uniref:Golgi to ER traffic protein 4 homolog n=2 Tax=Timema TaxID=61471 RepID=A0A7R9EI04_9NEOP|nr:unnamed protein product [Timema monikensis]
MISSMATGRVHGVQRVLAKLDSSLKAGNYYEAHQMYRTLYFRYLAQKKYTDLLDLLFDGAIVLLQHNQQASGADLAILLVAVLSKSGAVVSDEYVLEKLPKLFSLIKPDVPEREVFLMNALQWSCSGSQEHRTGHPELHKNIAQIFWKERNFAMARHHFLYSTDGFGCASLLVEIHKMRGYAAEVDLFIAQAVLQYLCLQNMSTAQAAFHCYTSQHPNIKRGPPYILPLLNFIWFLLKAVERAAVDLTVNTIWSSFSLLRDGVEVPPSTLGCSRMGIM